MTFTLDLDVVKVWLSWSEVI